jgi:sporulation protein YlmC with PRC-barrel domain
LYGADAVAKALGRATDVTIHAETGDYTMELVCSDKARSIPYDLAPNNKSYALQRMFAGLTGKVVKVTNNIIDMKTGRGNAVYVSIDLDTIPGMPAIESKAAVSVEDFEEEESMF